MGTIIYSKKWGVFLGVAMGLAFWSKLEPGGQDAAPAFQNQKQAQKFVQSWLPDSVPEDLEYIEADPDIHDGFVSMDKCVRMGLPMWLTETTRAANRIPI